MKSKTNQKENLLAKSLQRSAEFTKDDILDVIHWLRQLIGIAFGIVCGILPLTGAIGILFYSILSTLIVYAYLFMYLKNIDDRVYGETYFPLLQEGFFPAFAVFCVCNFMGTFQSNYAFTYLFCLL